MAASEPLLPAPFEYVRIFDLPAASSLPDELRGRALFSRATFVHAKPAEPGASSGKDINSPSTSASNSERISGPSRPGGGQAGKGRGKGSSAGFNYSKALRAAFKDAGSSCTSRGDGKFQDGRDFAVSDAPGGRAKLVHLTPEALAPGNAERTLQQLDQLQQRAGGGKAAAAGATGSGSGAGGGGAAPRAAAATPLAPTRSAQQQHAAALAAAANVLYDINDDDGDAAGRAAAAALAADATRPSDAAAPAGGLRIPEFTVRELPPQPPEDGLTGHQPAGQVEVSVLLPEVASPAEVDVWLGAGGVLKVVVPGKCQLKLDLPFPVLDDTSHAKWSKAKKRLTLTFTRQQ